MEDMTKVVLDAMGGGTAFFRTNIDFYSNV